MTQPEINYITSEEYEEYLKRARKERSLAVCKVCKRIGVFLGRVLPCKRATMLKSQSSETQGNKHGMKEGKCSK